LFAFAACIALAVIACVAIPQLRWRIQVLALHIGGRIPDIRLSEVVAYMMPGSDQVMTDLIERRNPYAVIKNAKLSDRDVASGAVLFLNKCSSCHGPDGGGSQIAPALVGRDFKHGDSDWAVYRTIRDGVANTAMAATPDLSETQRWQVISFVRSLGAAGNNNVAEAARPVIDVSASYETIAAKAQPDADWLTYSGSTPAPDTARCRGSIAATSINSR